MKKQPLGTVAKVRNGYAFDSSDFQQIGVPVVRMSDLNGDYVDTSDAIRVQEDFLKTHQNFLIKKGDIIVGMSGSLGKTAVYNSNEPALQNQRIGIYQLDENKVDKNFFRFIASSIENYLLNLGKGGTVKNISSKDIEEIEIPLPSIDEQRRIAGILDQADRLRRLRRHARQQTDTFLQSVFIAMFGNYLLPTVHTNFEEILQQPPNNGFFAKNEFYGSGTPVVWVDNLYHTNTINTLNLRRVRNIDEQTFKKYEVLEDDLLFTRSSLVRDGVGQVNIVPHLQEKTLFECHIIRARVDRKIVNPFYIQGLYRSAYGKRLILQKAKTATMTTISQDDLKELKCPIPPVDLQNKFECIVKKIEQLKAQQREAERQAEMSFQSLLHQAFSGQLTPVGLPV